MIKFILNNKHWLLLQKNLLIFHLGAPLVALGSVETKLDCVQIVAAVKGVRVRNNLFIPSSYYLLIPTRKFA